MPRAVRQKRGVPPMAAMSLRFTAADFQPRENRSVVARSKWTPSSSISVVARSAEEGESTSAAASSPMPMRTRFASRAAVLRICSMRPNSPRLDIFMETT